MPKAETHKHAYGNTCLYGYSNCDINGYDHRYANGYYDSDTNCFSNIYTHRNKLNRHNMVISVYSRVPI
jgi:hypothetical protein